MLFSEKTENLLNIIKKNNSDKDIFQSFLDSNFLPPEEFVFISQYQHLLSKKLILKMIKKNISNTNPDSTSKYVFHILLTNINDLDLKIKIFKKYKKHIEKHLKNNPISTEKFYEFSLEVKESGKYDIQDFFETARYLKNKFHSCEDSTLLLANFKEKFKKEKLQLKIYLAYKFLGDSIEIEKYRISLIRKFEKENDFIYFNNFIYDLLNSYSHKMTKNEIKKFFYFLKANNKSEKFLNLLVNLRDFELKNKLLNLFAIDIINKIKKTKKIKNQEEFLCDLEKLIYLSAEKSNYNLFEYINNNVSRFIESKELPPISSKDIQHFKMMNPLSIQNNKSDINCEP